MRRLLSTLVCCPISFPFSAWYSSNYNIDACLGDDSGKPIARDFAEDDWQCLRALYQALTG